jgi:hypothetical protein
MTSAATSFLRALTLLSLVVTAMGGSGCGADATPPPPPPPCDDKCKDGIVILAVRETAKLAYNLTLQGKPVGPQDGRTPCPFGGNVHVFGTASSNAIQGTTEVSLTYEMNGCSYQFTDDDPDDNYKTKLTGTLVQTGIIAVQPGSSTALIMKSESMQFEGTVHDPPIDVTLTCKMDLAQSGNILNGKLCDRDVKRDL